jgi:hypothetical protein
MTQDEAQRQMDSYRNRDLLPVRAWQNLAALDGFLDFLPSWL